MSRLAPPPTHIPNREWRCALRRDSLHEQDMTNLPYYARAAVHNCFATPIYRRELAAKRTRKCRRGLLRVLFDDLRRVNQYIVGHKHAYAALARQRRLDDTALKFHDDGVDQTPRERRWLIECFVESFDGLIWLEDREADVEVGGIRRPEAVMQSYRNELPRPLVIGINYLLDSTRDAVRNSRLHITPDVYSQIRKEVKSLWTAREVMLWPHKSMMYR